MVTARLACLRACTHVNQTLAFSSLVPTIAVRDHLSVCRERKEKGQKTDTSGHDATAPVNSLSVSELLNTVDYFHHLMFSQDRSKEKSRMPQNTHETLVATSGVSSASPKTSLSRKSPKSAKCALSRPHITNYVTGFAGNQNDTRISVRHTGGSKKKNKGVT